VPAHFRRHLAAERIRLGDALYRQEYFGAFASAPGSGDAEVLAHMFGDHTEEEPEGPVSTAIGRSESRVVSVQGLIRWRSDRDQTAHLTHTKARQPSGRGVARSLA
jgi:hypothetical protein